MAWLCRLIRHVKWVGAPGGPQGPSPPPSLQALRSASLEAYGNAGVQGLGYGER